MPLLLAAGFFVSIPGGFLPHPTTAARRSATNQLLCLTFAAAQPQAAALSHAADDIKHAAVHEIHARQIPRLELSKSAKSDRSSLGGLGGSAVDRAKASDLSFQSAVLWTKPTFI